MSDICITGCIKAKCLIEPKYCLDENETSEVQNLVVGLLAANTDYTLYFQDQNNGVMHSINLTSDLNGNLTFDMNQFPRFFHQGTAYMLWVTLEGAGLNDTEDISLGVEYATYPCVIIEFRKLTEDSETIVGAASQTVEI